MNIYYPNGSFSIDKDLVETIDGKNYITLVAKYEKTGGTGSTEVTDINYHSNDNSISVKDSINNLSGKFHRCYFSYGY